MILGVVGHEATKFTPEQKEKVFQLLRDAYRRLKPELVVSGACHLGGIDIWAIEIAKEMEIPTKEFSPENLQWEPNGYKKRNLQIATSSDHVVCIVVAKLPDTYQGMRFPTCYHCITRNAPHVKSGGCWTAWKAKSREWIIL